MFKRSRPPRKIVFFMFCLFSGDFPIQVEVIYFWVALFKNKPDVRHDAHAHIHISGPYCFPPIMIEYSCFLFHRKGSGSTVRYEVSDHTDCNPSGITSMRGLVEASPRLMERGEVSQIFQNLEGSVHNRKPIHKETNAGKNCCSYGIAKHPQLSRGTMLLPVGLFCIGLAMYRRTAS